MMLLVTTSHSLLRVDPHSGAVEPLHRGQGLYFGIASDGDRWFVAARRRMVSSTVPHHEESGRILVFDRSFRLIDEIGATFPLRDMHEIMWHAGRLWVACSFDNMVAILDPQTKRWEVWHPLGPTPEPPYDVNHLNSFAVVAGRLCIVAHNFGASELLRFDIRTRELVSREPFGVQAHNIRELPGGALLTCSSGEGALVTTDGQRIETGGFPRGIVMAANATYVGISQIAERHERDLSTGHIMTFDRDWKCLSSLPLPGEGLVLELQPATPGNQ